jgi:hypothetical protein
VIHDRAGGLDVRHKWGTMAPASCVRDGRATSEDAKAASAATAGRMEEVLAAAGGVEQRSHCKDGRGRGGRRSAANEHGSSFLQRGCAGGRGPQAKPGREKSTSAVELESGAGSARRHAAAARWGSEATVEDNREKGTMAIIAKT